MPRTFTDEELREHESNLRKEGRAQFEQELLKDTTWKTATDLRESAVNADKRIGQSVQKEREAVEKTKTLEQQLEELKKGSAGGGGQAGGKGDDDLVRDPAAYLRTLTDAEEKALDEMSKNDPDLGRRIVAGGEKAMAEALKALRKVSPPASKGGIAPDSPFASYRKNSAGTGAVPLEQAIEEAHKKYLQRHRQPAGGPRGTPAAGASGQSDDAPPPKRGTGGMSVFRADAE